MSSTPTFIGYISHSSAYNISSLGRIRTVASCAVPCQNGRSRAILLRQPFARMNHPAGESFQRECAARLRPGSCATPHCASSRLSAGLQTPWRTPQYSAWPIVYIMPNASTETTLSVGTGHSAPCGEPVKTIFFMSCKGSPILKQLHMCAVPPRSASTLPLALTT
jgi:hypothetical protein